jgi:hypothetical protein
MKMPADDTRALGAIGAMFTELLECQMALVELLRSQPVFDENAYREGSLRTRCAPKTGVDRQRTEY